MIVAACLISTLRVQIWRICIIYYNKGGTDLMDYILMSTHIIERCWFTGMFHIELKGFCCRRNNWTTWICKGWLARNCVSYRISQICFSKSERISPYVAKSGHKSQSVSTNGAQNRLWVLTIALIEVRNRIGYLSVSRNFVIYIWVGSRGWYMLRGAYRACIYRNGKAFGSRNRTIVIQRNVTGNWNTLPSHSFIGFS